MASKWLKDTLLSAAVTQPGSVASVTPLPTMDKLAEKIRAANNDLVTAQAEHARIEIARDNEMREFEAAISTSNEARNLIEERLRDLRRKLADQVRALGIKAEVPE